MMLRRMSVLMAESMGSVYTTFRPHRELKRQEHQADETGQQQQARDAVIAAAALPACWHRQEAQLIGNGSGQAWHRGQAHASATGAWPQLMRIPAMPESRDCRLWVTHAWQA